MEKKILRTQLYTLFVLTTLNLIYFYYRDNLPDHYFEIAAQNQSINFFSYYFFTILANFGYWCGIWITACFVTFAVLNSLVFTKKKDPKNLAVVATLLPLTILLCYLVFPETLGEGIYFLIRENLNTLYVCFSIIILGTSFFYLVSEKHFLKTCKFIAKKTIQTAQAIREADYSAIRSRIAVIQQQTVGLLARLKTTEKVTRPVQEKKLKITEAKRSLPMDQVLPPVEEEQAIQVDEETEPVEEEISDEFEELQTQFNDSEIDETGDEDESEEEFEEDESPFIAKEEDKFFEPDELINCIIPKNQSHALHDPDDEYFEKIALSIEQKLKQFNIAAQVINVLKGPVVDTFELKLGEGVRSHGSTDPHGLSDEG
jgi:S-DNA-T family DNA segregation ATPase FtsK/SpoIIIE